MKTRYQVLIIIFLIIILVVMCFLIFKGSGNNSKTIKQFNLTTNSEDESETTTVTASGTSEISSALTENIELHATYYFSKCYVEEGEQVSEGDKILKYTNGKYLYAPYDCVIEELNIPSKSEQCTNEHYVSVSSINSLKTTLSVDETKISSFAVGDTAKITVSAFDDKTLEGYITKISNTASNGKFTVTVEFENDGEIKLGMTATTTI